jgi:hypothetical protein
MKQRELKSSETFVSKLLFKLSILLIGLVIISRSVRGQTNTSEYGYKVKGDSVEFVFGQEKTIMIGRQPILLKDRFNEIRVVNVAGDFNHWNPKDGQYAAVMGKDKIFRLTVAKKQLGNKGETKQFKFVINHEYWIEPPKEAVNRFTGKDGNSNLTLKL